MVNQYIFGHKTTHDNRHADKKFVLTVTSSMCILSRTCLIVSTGHGDPAIIPVYKDERSKDEKF